MGFFASLFGGYSEDAYGSSEREISVIIASADSRTGVSRYLDDQKQVSTPLSRVEKYLQQQEQNQPSGVAKYLARQAIAEKNKPVVILSGVDKYLKNNANSSSPIVVRTGVAKYLDKQDKTPMSRVAKYALQKSIEERNAPQKPKQTRVESYLQSLPETQKSSVSKYLARQAAVVVQNQPEIVITVETAVPEAALTGVAKYLQAQR